MSRRWWNALIVGMWLFMPAMALRYWLVWDRLPAYMATHFDAANRPNGWMTPQGSLRFIEVLMFFMLAVFTVIIMQIRKPDVAYWAVLGLFYVILGTLYVVNDSVLDYNLHQRPINLSLGMVLLFAAIFTVATIILGTKRGTTLPDSTVLAEETHTGGAWTLVFVIPLGIELGVMAGNGSWGGDSHIRHGRGLERISLSVYEGGNGSPDAGLPPTLHTNKSHSRICDCALEPSRRLWHPRSRRAPGLCVGQ